MKRTDVEAIADLAKNHPLVDVASFIFTAKHRSLRSLAALWPDVGEDCKKVNHWFAQAWHEFALEFNAALIGPSNQNLFKVLLMGDDITLFASIRELETQEYCRKLMNKPWVSKLNDYKVSTVIALANGTFDGPLCDALVPLVGLCDVEELHGFWVLDSRTGHTRIDEATGLCQAVSPKLRDGADADVAALKRGLRARVLGGLTLTEAA